MEIKNTLNQSAPPINAAVIHRVQRLLGELSAQQLADLASYARHQCARSRWHHNSDRFLAAHDGQELVHEVFEDILVGLENPHQGRHPRAEDLADLETFIVYLRGAIRSKRLNLAEHVEAKTEHLDLADFSDDQNTASLHSESDPAKETEYSDLKRVAFERLRRELKASGEIIPALDLWEKHLSHINKAAELGLTSKQFRNIRKRLRRIFLKLGFGRDNQPRTGEVIVL